jgi:hypothetical protein
LGLMSGLIVMPNVSIAALLSLPSDVGRRILS